jgi:hypothetical protein
MSAVAASKPPLPVVFITGAMFAYAGWYYFFRTQEICDKVARNARIPFLAKAFSGRAAYIWYKVIGVMCFLVSLLIFAVGVFRLLAR